MKAVFSILLLTTLTRPVFGEELKIYAAAAVKAPLGDVVSQYEATTGNKVMFVLDTAGATEQRFREDPRAGLLITAVAVINDAAKTGRLKGGTTHPLGTSLAGIAFFPGSPKPDISTPEKLKAALLSAKRIAFSDPARGATVGIHFMKVIDSLGIKDEILRKSTVATDGIETMRLVLEEKYDLGVTQVSEIIQANRNAVAGPFPKEFELATTFSLWYRNDAPPAAKAFVNLLTSPEIRKKLDESGIRPPAE